MWEKCRAFSRMCSARVVLCFGAQMNSWSILHICWQICVILGTSDVHVSVSWQWACFCVGVHEMTFIVSRETVWHSESTKRVGKVRALRHGERCCSLVRTAHSKLTVTAVADRARMQCKCWRRHSIEFHMCPLETGLCLTRIHIFRKNILIYFYWILSICDENYRRDVQLQLCLCVKKKSRLSA